MEEKDINSSGLIELGGDNVVIPESESTNRGSGDDFTTESKPKDSKNIGTSVKEISKKAYINVIKRPFSLIAKVRGRDYWKLDKDEETDIGESYECVAKVIPGYFVKYFCFVNFGVNMFSIIIRRLMEDKKIRDEQEEEGEEEIKEAQGNTEKRALRSGNSTSEKGTGKGKIGKGVRSG